MGYALTTIIDTVKTGNSITYGIFLLGMVIQSILGNQEVVVFFWAKDIALWSVIVRDILYFYPPFLMAKCFSDIVRLSGYDFSGTQFRWVLGPGYTWNDFVSRKVGKDALNVAFDSPSTAYMVF